MRVCKLWNQLANSPKVWKSLYLRDYFGVDPEDDQNWKVHYKKVLRQLQLIESSIREQKIQKTDLRGVYPLYLNEGKFFTRSVKSQIKCMDVKTSTPLSVFNTKYQPNVMSVSGDRFFYSHYGKTIHVWNIKTNEQLKELKVPVFNITALCVGSGMLFGATHLVIYVWKIFTGEHFRSLEGHKSETDALCASGDYLFSAGPYDKTIKVWNITRGTLIRTLVHDENGGVDSLCASLDKLFSAGSYDCNVRIWAIETGTLLHTLIGHTADITTLCFWGGLLFSGSDDNSIRIWKAETGAHLQTIQTYPADFVRQGGAVRSLCMNNGKLHSGHKNGEGFSWDFVGSNE